MTLYIFLQKVDRKGWKMRFLLVSFLAIALSCGAAADIILGPFDTTASFDPQEIVLAPGSGDFYVNVNLDWSWAQGIPFPGHEVSLHLSFVDEYGNVAAQFSIPDQYKNLDGFTVYQHMGGISAFSTVPDEFPYMPLHIEYDGLSEGSYLVEFAEVGCKESVYNLIFDKAFAIPTAEPLRITVVPEPCTLAIAGMGFLGLAWARRRLRKGIRK